MKGKSNQGARAPQGAKTLDFQNLAALCRENPKGCSETELLERQTERSIQVLHMYNYTSTSSYGCLFLSALLSGCGYKSIII